MATNAASEASSSSLSLPFSAAGWRSFATSNSAPSQPYASGIPKLPVPWDMSKPGVFPKPDDRHSQFAMANTAAELIPPFDPSISVESLPLMAWVIVLSPAALAQYASGLVERQDSG